MSSIGVEQFLQSEDSNGGSGDVKNAWGTQKSEIYSTKFHTWGARGSYGESADARDSCVAQVCLRVERAIGYAQLHCRYRTKDLVVVRIRPIVFIVWSHYKKI